MDLLLVRSLIIINGIIIIKKRTSVLRSFGVPYIGRRCVCMRFASEISPEEAAEYGMAGTKALVNSVDMHNPVLQDVWMKNNWKLDEKSHRVRESMGVGIRNWFWQKFNKT